MNPPSYWLMQYLIAAIFSLPILFYALYNERRDKPLSQALKYFFIYGFAVSLWEISAYLQRTATNADNALIFFQLSSILGMLSQSAYVASILSIRRRPRRLMLIFLPITLDAYIITLSPDNLRLTQYGWSHIPNQFSTISIIEATIYMGYLASATFFLADLIMKARSEELKIKYGILLGSLLALQYPSIILTNLFTVDSKLPPLDGSLYFAALLLAGCALMIWEKIFT